MRPKPFCPARLAADAFAHRSLGQMEKPKGSAVFCLWLPNSCSTVAFRSFCRPSRTRQALHGFHSWKIALKASISNVALEVSHVQGLRNNRADALSAGILNPQYLRFHLSNQTSHHIASELECCVASALDALGSLMRLVRHSFSIAWTYHDPFV